LHPRSAAYGLPRRKDVRRTTSGVRLTAPAASRDPARSRDPNDPDPADVLRGVIGAAPSPAKSFDV